MGVSDQVLAYDMRMALQAVFLNSREGGKSKNLTQEEGIERPFESTQEERKEDTTLKGKIAVQSKSTNPTVKQALT